MGICIARFQESENVADGALWKQSSCLSRPIHISPRTDGCLLG